MQISLEPIVLKPDEHFFGIVLYRKSVQKPNFVSIFWKGFTFTEKLETLNK